MTNVIIYSLGMTLLHSLWQIVLIYAILRLSLALLVNGKANFRYNISGSALFLTFLAAVVTFNIYFLNGKAEVITSQAVSLNLETETIPHYIQGIQEGNMESGITLYNLFPYIVSVYLIGVFILALKLTGSLLFLRRYARRDTAAANRKTKEIFYELIKKFRFNRKIILVESLRAKTPMVIGYLKPVIIVPVGIFTHLPFNQVEAILAHELAHIKRNDFLINIIQSVVELLFFYHPVIYLISKHIREERENCCDDIALQFCKDSSQYVKALASMEGILPANPYPAVAFVQKKNNLLNRMKRILKSNDMKTKLSDRIVAGSIILAGILTLVLTGAAALNNISAENATPVEDSASQAVKINNIYPAANQADTIINYGENHIVTHRINEDGKNQEIEINFSNGKISSLKVDGKVIPESDYPQYRTVIENAREEVANASSEVEKAEKELDKIKEEEIEKEIQNAMEEVKQMDQEEIQKELEKARAEMEKIDQEKLQQEIELAMEEAKREMEESGMNEINWDSIQNEVSKAMDSIDWEEIHSSIEKAMEEVEYNSEEMEMAIMDTQKAMEEIDWEGIQESVYRGLEAAKISMESIDWDMLAETIDLSIDISADVLDNISVEIESALKEVESLDISAEIEDARKDVQKEKKKLNELDRNMEKALEELEKK